MPDQPPGTPRTPVRRRLSRVLKKLREMRLLQRKSMTVTARLNAVLPQIARTRAGVESNDALVDVAAADRFPEAFVRARWRVPADIDFGI